MKKYLLKLKYAINGLIFSLFRKKKQIRLGLYGPPNAGKSTLANKITKTWIGEDFTKTSSIEHETRQIITKENVQISSKGKKLFFNIIDTPGIATKIDYEDFVKKGISKKDAKQRAKEATKGVIDAIKWLDKVDAVLVVLDATKEAMDQVNITIIGNLEARGIPVIIVANKIDKKESSVQNIRDAFSQYSVVGISAKTGDGLDYLYEKLFYII
ncbi:MAG: GTP-binding protein [Candidatus Aenigmarchaeota archaeon ex4484_52]|nr:MAG: GTP-binding protein [Candidatus Aenigmarchaeota archaeon ex4484_52]